MVHVFPVPPVPAFWKRALSWTATTAGPLTLYHESVASFNPTAFSQNELSKKFFCGNIYSLIHL